LGGSPKPCIVQTPGTSIVAHAPSSKSTSVKPAGTAVGAGARTKRQRPSSVTTASASRSVAPRLVIGSRLTLVISGAAQKSRSRCTGAESSIRFAGIASRPFCR
jgi:hypothetical protein